MKTLAIAVQGRDNHFHLLRLLAATMVLVSHSFAIALGDPLQEPLRRTLGVTPGTIAVDVFFLISGLLVTQSLERRADLRAFVLARAARILPGLAVAVVFMVLILGPAMSTFSAAAYLQEPQTWRFLRAQATVLYRYTEVFLPRVFVGNPVGRVVNGSLWTLEWEVRAYFSLAAAWGVTRAWARLWAAAPGFRAVVAAATVGLLAWHAWALTQVDIEASPPRLYAMFALGCCACLWREHIPWHPALWPVALSALVVSGLLGKPVFTAVYTATLPLAALGLAYGAPKALLGYNRLGDYSYGLYIYAYPVQQSVAALYPGCSVLALGLASWAMTLALAVVSWHAVESPTLRWLARRNVSRSLRPSGSPADPGA